MSMTEAANQIRKLIEITANNLTDEQAQELPYCFPVWEEGIEVKEGERYRVASPSAVATLSARSVEEPMPILYRCKKAHVSAESTYPEDAPELWDELKGE